jgi:hypothetical protein
MIHKNKGTYHPPRAERKYTAHVKAMANVGIAGFYYKVKHSWRLKSGKLFTGLKDKSFGPMLPASMLCLQASPLKNLESIR